MLVNQIYATESKCMSEIRKIEYVWHFVSGNMVETDPEKIE